MFRSSAFRSKCDIVSAMVAKRLFCGRVPEAPHPSNDDKMIACFNTIVKCAIQPSGGIGKYRAARDAGHPRRVGKFVGRLRSECPGDVLLTFGKDVDSKMGCAGEGRIAACGLTDAYQNQRWIEGDRRKGVGRKAFRNSHRIEGGCHGDAGREAAERSSQFRYIHCSGVELLDF